MALIKIKKRVSTNTYSWIFNNKKLGSLISSIHAAAISTGSELEKTISVFSKQPVIK